MLLLQLVHLQLVKLLLVEHQTATAEVVTWTSGTNTLTVKSVSNEFTVVNLMKLITTSGASARQTATGVTYAGDAVESGNAVDAFVGTAPTYSHRDREEILIEHSNHGMHDLR